MISDEEVREVYTPVWERAFKLGHENGWVAARTILALRDCTIRNDGTNGMRIYIGRDEAFIDLEPGEEVSLRTVNPDEGMVTQHIQVHSVLRR